MCSIYGWIVFHCIYVQLFYPFICQWTFRLLPCPTIVNSAAMNNGIHASFSILVSSGYMPSGGIAQSYGGFIPSFLRNLHTAFHGGCINLHSYQQLKSVPFFSTPSPAFIVCRLSDDGHSDQSEVISHCSFDLHFSNNERCWAFFHVFVSHQHVFFGEMSV